MAYKSPKIRTVSLRNPQKKPRQPQNSRELPPIKPRRLVAPSDLPELQRSFGNNAVSRLVAPSSGGSPLAAAIGARQGKGDMLPADVKHDIEGEFHLQLGAVRLHTDEHAQALSQALNARAFAAGQDIFFNRGAYDPRTPAGIRLLKHELMHVVQQGGHFSPDARLGSHDETAEREARLLSRAGPASVPTQRPTPFSAVGLIQRDDFEKQSGSANEVYEVKRGEMTKSTVGYWKPDAERDDPFDPESPLVGKSNMGAKAVLSSDVDQMLGTGVLSKETYTTHEGRGGSLSSKVQGTTISDTDFETPTTKEVYDSSKLLNKSMFKKGKKVEGQPRRYFQKSGNTLNRHDFTNPNTQRDLANLQLQDALMGQYDRHGGNIKIDDATGAARGFDNDNLERLTRESTVAFPNLRDVNQLHTPRGPLGFKKPKALRSKEEIAAKTAAREQAREWLKSPDGKHVGLPSHIDQRTAEQVRGMKSKAFMSQLQARNPENAARMDPQHMQELKERYSALRRYVKEGFLPQDQKREDSPEIVGEHGWGQDTYQAQLARGSEHSYLARSVSDYNQAQAGPGGQVDSGGQITRAKGAEYGPLPTSAEPSWYHPPAHAQQNAPRQFLNRRAWAHPHPETARLGNFLRQPAPPPAQAHAPMPADPTSAPAPVNPRQPQETSPGNFATVPGMHLGEKLKAQLKALQQGQ